MVKIIRLLPVVLLAITVTLSGCEEDYQASVTPDSRRPFIIYVLNNEGHLIL